MKSIFTIVSHSHVSHGLASLASLRQNLNSLNNNENRYIVYVTDYQHYLPDIVENISIVPVHSLNLPDYQNLLNKALNRSLTKYELRQRVKNLDTFRWALKPCIIEYLLSISKECIYIDSDLYFINDIYPTIESIKNIGLSPHFRPYATTEIFKWMSDQNIIGDTNVFTDGYFNGGFFVCKNTPTSLNAIDWWKRCCLSRCEINKEVGFYVDQKYLDYMYMHFDGIDKINDLGCNIAEWNIYSYNITDIDLENNYFLINNKFIPKFFHFSGGNFKNHSIMYFFYKQFDKSIEHYSSIINKNEHQ